MNLTIDTQAIERFLHGSNPKQYVVSIEASYNTNFVYLITNNPSIGKKIEKHSYKPFLWFKHDVVNVLYGGKKLKQIEAAKRFGIKTKRLRVSNENGDIPDRLANGYCYTATCSKSYNDLVNFFKEGGVNPFEKQYSKLFFMFAPAEQFMIQTGIRMFKGMEDYDDLHRLQFDLETEGLFASKNAIFQIGIRDNRGFEEVLESKGNTPQERRDSERLNIIRFFEIISEIQPDVITGYNSESFDWPFYVERGIRLSVPIEQIAFGLDGTTRFKRKPAMLKLGNEMEPFMQTYLWGYNVIDISHSVRRAQSINSDIKSWSLKYITQYSEIAKKNRVYVPGDKINSIWADKENKYAFNNTNGDWYRISERMPLKENYEIMEGDYIVQRYLLDDLWETEQIDITFNQAAFLISKLLPTNYSRSSTMGTATQWKLIMASWSYENDLAIPETEAKRDFTGGLSRLLELGYSRNVVKFDYAALYPKSQLTHNVFPKLDISGVMKGLLEYIVDTRDKFKFLTDKHKKIVKKLKAELEENINNYSPEKLEQLRKEIDENKTLQSRYDKKQLPLKILANSWFGAYGAPYIFNWGDTDCAEETTCLGRQYLRLMVKHFHEKHGFKPLVGDSVTYDTPVYIKYKNGELDIKPICDLFNDNSKFLDKEGFRDYEEKPFEILTVNGWKSINYVYKHETTKQIHRIITKDRLVNVTEDHSLFQDGVQIKPSNLKRGDKIDVYNNLEKFDTTSNISEESAWLYGFFLGEGSANCARTRKKDYTSRKSGNVKTYITKRSDWKISNTKTHWLEKLNEILKTSFNQIGIIKNHLKSSGVHDLVVHNADFTNQFCNEFYTSYREKKVPSFILNSSDRIKRAFLEGACASDGYGDTLDTCIGIGMKSQVAMAGIALLFKDLNIEYKINSRKDKENFITLLLKNRYKNGDFSSFKNKSRKKSNEVWLNKNIKNKDTDGYVYDISTEDGTFIGGIGLVNLKNTDGMNFSFPDDVDKFKYLAKGSHWKTTDYANQELSGLDAVLAEFNETYMLGRMGLDIDDIYNSTINFSRKNYANDMNGKVKLVGNSIKSKKMPTYIEDFLGKAIRLLLDGNGKAFINLYYEHVDKIYNYNIPMVKIASKSKVKSTISDYKKRASKKNKAGNPLPKQAHMELAVNAGLEVNLGDILYYVNTGTAKSHGDLKSVKKENGMTEIQMNCKLIDAALVESDMEVIKEIETLKKILLDIDKNDVEKIEEMQNQILEKEGTLYKEDYNVAKYLEAFNKKVKPLLVCFDLEIRNEILLTIKKEKKTKIEKLTERKIFTEHQCQLVSGMSNKKGDQDTYEELMTMEDKEIKFWMKVEKLPNNMLPEEWNEIQIDYIERKRIERLEGIGNEKKYLDDIFRRLEFDELKKIKTLFVLPDDVILIASVNDNYEFVSRKWDFTLCDLNDIFKYEKEAIQRSIWYQMENLHADDRYEQWIEYTTIGDKNELIDVVMSGDAAPIDITQSIEIIQDNIEKFESTRPKIKSNKKKITDDEEDNDDEDSEEDNKRDEEIILEAEPEEYKPELDGLVPDDFFEATEATIEKYPPEQKIEPIKKVPDIIKVSLNNWNF